MVDNYIFIALLRPTVSLKAAKLFIGWRVGKQKAKRLIAIDINIAIRRKCDFALNRHFYIIIYTNVSINVSVNVYINAYTNAYIKLYLKLYIKPFIRPLKTSLNIRSI